MEPSLPFDAHTFIDAMLVRCPKLAEVLNAHGMACVGCVFSRFHSLTDAAAIYHLDANQLVDELAQSYATRCVQNPINSAPSQ